MTPQPRAFFALDFGTATTSAALIAHVGDRWRLVAEAAAPAAASADALLVQLVEGVRIADPDLFAGLEPESRGPVTTAGAVESWLRLEAHSSPRRRVAVLAGARRQRLGLEDVARRAGWEVVAANADEDDPLQMTCLMLSPDTHALLVGADDPPDGDERRLLGLVGAIAAAAVARRPEVAIVLAGGASTLADTFAAVLATNAGSRGRDAAGEPRIQFAPGPADGEPAGSALQRYLEGLRVTEDDSRLAMTRSVASLSFVLDRSVELVEVGMDGGLRCRAEPLPGEGHKTVGLLYASIESAALLPPDPSEDLLDAILAWSSVPLDRYRLGDRVRDMRLSPWGDADGDGLALRIAAARASLERLVAATPDITERPAPDVLVASGGVWVTVPPPVVALALADIVRRPGTSQLALDHARVLAPLGTIEEEDDRRQMLADLADDLLLPLGSIIVPAGLRMGREAGTLRVASDGATVEFGLLPGGIELVDLPAGQSARAELEFHETVHLGVRGREFATEVTGGLGGLLVDLRDVPLRLPDRGEERRQLLAGWQRALWPEAD